MAPISTCVVHPSIGTCGVLRSPFSAVLIDPGSASLQQQCAADVFVDGAVDMQDVDAFVQAVLNP